MNPGPEPQRDNFVEVKGKVSGREPLAYTPSGTAILEFKLAVVQEFLSKKSTGYFPVMFMGETAEKWSRDLRVGKKLCVRGFLWCRQFKDRKGRPVSEFKVIADTIEGE